LIEGSKPHFDQITIDTVLEAACDQYDLW